MAEEAKVHPFEKAGLGRAPFRFVYSYRKVGPWPMGDGSFVGAPGQPVGSCDYCSEGIATVCVIQDADGKRFEVGNVCVARTSEKAMVDAVKRAVRKLDLAERHKKEAARIEAAKATLPAVSAKLAAMPHPMKHMADRGHTALSFVKFMLENAGNAGKIRAARMIEAAAKTS